MVLSKKILKRLDRLIDWIPEPSSCTIAALLVTVIFVFFARCFPDGSLPSTPWFSPFCHIMMILSAILTGCSLAINGFYPTFCMSLPERGIDRRLRQRQ